MKTSILPQTKFESATEALSRQLRHIARAAALVSETTKRRLLDSASPKTALLYELLPADAVVTLRAMGLRVVWENEDRLQRDIIDLHHHYRLQMERAEDLYSRELNVLSQKLDEAERLIAHLQRRGGGLGRRRATGRGSRGGEVRHQAAGPSPAGRGQAQSKPRTDRSGANKHQRSSRKPANATPTPQPE